MPMIRGTHIPPYVIKDLVESEGVTRTAIINQLWRENPVTWSKTKSVIEAHEREQSRKDALLNQTKSKIEKALEPVA